MRDWLLSVAILCALAAPAHSAEPAEVDAQIDAAVSLLELVLDVDADSARGCLATITAKVQNRELAPQQVAALKKRLAEKLATILDGPADHALYGDCTILAASFGDAKGIAAAKKLFAAVERPVEQRGQAFAAVAISGDPAALEMAEQALKGEPRAYPAALQAAVLAALNRLESPKVAAVVLAAYPKLAADLQPKAIELLTQRPAWARLLVAAVDRQELPVAVLNTNQIARLLAGNDKELAKLVAAKWGTVRLERNPQREQVVAEMKALYAKQPGDPRKGQLAFTKLCAQCHKIHGAGQEVGPDLTSNGRASFDQLLSNMFDPSLVIGAAYQSRSVETEDGRQLTGLLAEESDQRVVLKLQGGKLETIPRDQVVELRVSPLSLMPEGIEKQYAQQELLDLIAYLALDRPPEDPQAKWLPGTPVK